MCYGSISRAVRHIDLWNSTYCGSPRLKTCFDNRYLLPKYEPVNRIKNYTHSIVSLGKLARYFLLRIDSSIYYIILHFILCILDKSMYIWYFTLNKYKFYYFELDKPLFREINSLSYKVVWESICNYTIQCNIYYKCNV